MIAQQRHPAAERAGHTCSDQARTGDLGETQIPDALDGRRRRSRPLAADHLWALSRRIPEQDRHLAAETVEVRLDDLEHESGGTCRIEGVAAPIEHCHRALRGEPVGRADHAERALELRPRGEGHQ